MAIGPSTSTNPYLIATEPNVRFTSIATVGDVIGTKPNGSPYRMVGIPDGLGAYDNGNGTFTVLMNHELPATAGIVREHGAAGAFVSQLVIDKSTLKVVSTEDAIKSVQLYNDVTDTFSAATYAIGRLCAADLAEVSAYYNAATGLGTTDRIFMTGEENGSEGKQFGLVVTGADAGKAFELAYLGLYSWENSVTSPFAQNKTVNISTDDSGGGQVYVYIGEKQATGNAVEKAGLVGGDLYGIDVGNIVNESNAGIAGGAFSLVKLGIDGDVSALTGVQLEAESVAKGVTGFLRPEDIHWDPTNPAVAYFVTTNAFNNPSRLYKLTFADITDPTLGGTIEAVLDGTEGQQMLDNITVDANGKLILQEDPGGQNYIAKMWHYDPVTDVLTQIAQHDPALFVPGMPNFKTIDEESSGVIDVTTILGDADTQVFLLDDQVHRNLTDPELVQEGQLLAMYVDKPKNGDNFDNVINGGVENDTLSGGNGNDTMRGGSGLDVLSGDNGNDNIDGMGGNDWLDGGNGNDVIVGGLGADTIYGGNGNDDLSGGGGDDVIVGGKGNDKLAGGEGADEFRFSTGDANDTIADFEVGIDSLFFESGRGVRSSSVSDVNRDGEADTILRLAGGGTITLLGVDNFRSPDVGNTLSQLRMHDMSIA